MVLQPGASSLLLPKGGLQPLQQTKSGPLRPLQGLQPLLPRSLLPLQQQLSPTPLTGASQATSLTSPSFTPALHATIPARSFDPAAAVASTAAVATAAAAATAAATAVATAFDSETTNSNSQSNLTDSNSSDQDRDFDDTDDDFLPDESHPPVQNVSKRISRGGAPAVIVPKLNFSAGGKLLSSAPPSPAATNMAESASLLGVAPSRVMVTRLRVGVVADEDMDDDSESLVDILFVEKCVW